MPEFSRTAWTDERLSDRFDSITRQLDQIHLIGNGLHEVRSEVRLLRQELKERNRIQDELAKAMKEETRGMTRGEKLTLGTLLVLVISVIVAVIALLANPPAAAAMLGVIVSTA